MLKTNRGAGNGISIGVGGAGDAPPSPTQSNMTGITGATGQVPLSPGLAPAIHNNLAPSPGGSMQQLPVSGATAQAPVVNPVAPASTPTGLSGIATPKPALRSMGGGMRPNVY